MDCLRANACWNDIQLVFIIQSKNNMTLYFSSILSFEREIDGDSDCSYWKDMITNNIHCFINFSIKVKENTMSSAYEKSVQ